jgi:hypothetical protein
MLETMDACRVRWGRVIEVAGNTLVVAARRLELSGGRLRIGAERVEEAVGWQGAAGVLDGVVGGDWVSLHWGWACDRLTSDQLRRLAVWTDAAIASANRSC